MDRARLRNRTFFSLAELNGAIRELLEKLNERPFRKLPGSRKTLLESLESRPPPRAGLPVGHGDHEAGKGLRA